MSLACGDCIFCTVSDKENVSTCKKTGKTLSEKYVNGWYIPKDLSKPGFCDNFISRFEEKKMNENVTFGNWNHISNLKDYPRKDVNCYHLLVCPSCGACHRAKLCNDGKLINANYCPNCGKDMRKEEA